MCLLEYSAFFGWSLELSFSPSLLQLVKIHIYIVYSIVILPTDSKLDLYVSWHDRGQAIAIDALPLQHIHCFCDMKCIHMGYAWVGFLIIILWTKSTLEMFHKHFFIFSLAHLLLIFLIILFLTFFSIIVIFGDIFLWFCCRLSIIFVIITFSLTFVWLLVHFIFYGNVFFVIILTFLCFHFIVCMSDHMVLKLCVNLIH